MSKAEAIFPALIFVMAATFVALGYFVLNYAWISLVFPLAAGLTVCALCAYEIAAILRGRRETAPPATSTGDDEAVPLSLPSLAWMFALAVFLYALGFVAGPAVYLLACLRANGFSWRLSGGISAVSIVVTWGLFIKVMGVQLPIWPMWMS